VTNKCWWAPTSAVPTHQMQRPAQTDTAKARAPCSQAVTRPCSGRQQLARAGSSHASEANSVCVCVCVCVANMACTCMPCSSLEAAAPQHLSAAAIFDCPYTQHRRDAIPNTHTVWPLPAVLQARSRRHQITEPSSGRQPTHHQPEQHTRRRRGVTHHTQTRNRHTHAAPHTYVNAARESQVH
jgi:hypothetical protein